MAVGAMTTDRLRVYFARVKGVYRELFNMAHAICGNYELAEYAVQRALLTCFLRSGRLKSRVGFRENLRAAVRREAVEQVLLLGDAELNWDGFREDAIDGAQGDLVLSMASGESSDARRLLVLRYGCALRIGQIARVLRMPPKQVRAALDRFERRARKRFPARERGRVDARIAGSARVWLAQHTGGVPDTGTVYRSFEAEVMETGGGGPRLSRIFAAVLTGILAILCAGIFWVTMVLLQPPEMEEPKEPAAQIDVQPEAVQEAQPTAQPEAAQPGARPKATGGGSGTYFDLLN